MLVSLENLISFFQIVTDFFFFFNDKNEFNKFRQFLQLRFFFLFDIQSPDQRNNHVNLRLAFDQSWDSLLQFCSRRWQRTNRRRHFSCQGLGIWEEICGEKFMQIFQQKSLKKSILEFASSESNKKFFFLDWHNFSSMNRLSFLANWFLVQFFSFQWKIIASLNAAYKFLCGI